MAADLNIIKIGSVQWCVPCLLCVQAEGGAGYVHATQATARATLRQQAAQVAAAQATAQADAAVTVALSPPVSEAVAWAVAGVGAPSATDGIHRYTRLCLEHAWSIHWPGCDLLQVAAW